MRATFCDMFIFVIIITIIIVVDVDDVIIIINILLFKICTLIFASFFVEKIIAY